MLLVRALQVIGAGIGGLTCAALLAQVGHDTEHVDVVLFLAFFGLDSASINIARGSVSAGNVACHATST